MPHLHCYLGKPPLVWTMFVTDLLIGLAYVGISITLYFLVRRIRLPFSAVVLCFGLFIGACGATHFMEVWTLWNPDYWFSASVKVVTAIASVGTGIYLFQLRHPIALVAEAAKLSEQRRLDLEGLTKDLEIRVAERTAELQSAVIARDEFLSIASHELKTPITTMKMQAQLAKRSFEKMDPTERSGERVVKMLEQSDRQLDRLARLVDDMLDISRISTGKLAMNPERVDLSTLAGEVVERYRHEFKQAGAKIDLVSDGAGAVGNWDRLRIEQVISNLLVNALRYGRGKPVRVVVGSDGGAAILKVQDQGIGIAAEDHERIFSRFERAVPASEGSGLGLGLYIVRQILENHGGSIWVDSAPGKGATFTVRLPIRQST